MNSSIQVYQQGEGEPLILLHGWGMNAQVFQPLLENELGDFAVTRVDLPGYGRSPWDDVDFEQQLDELHECLPSGTLIAWSMGGVFATQLAHRYPEKYHRLVLVSCNPCFVQRTDWPAAVERSVFVEFSQDLIENWQGTIRRFIGLQMHGVAQSRQLIRQITDLLVTGGSPDERALRFGLDLLLQQDVRNDLSRIEVPVLFILGARDALVPKRIVPHLTRINPAFRVECLARSAHAPFLSHSVEFTGLLREFVKSTPAG